MVVVAVIGGVVIDFVAGSGLALDGVVRDVVRVHGLGGGGSVPFVVDLHYLSVGIDGVVCVVGGVDVLSIGHS